MQVFLWLCVRWVPRLPARLLCHPGHFTKEEVERLPTLAPWQRQGRTLDHACLAPQPPAAAKSRTHRCCLVL